MVFMNRWCGTKTVFCDGECDCCILRLLKTPDGTQLYPGENKDGFIKNPMQKDGDRHG